jgi:hypothetical protein
MHKSNLAPNECDPKEYSRRAHGGSHGTKQVQPIVGDSTNWSWAAGLAGQSFLSDQKQTEAEPAGTEADRTPAKMEGIQKEISSHVCCQLQSNCRCVPVLLSVLVRLASSRLRNHSIGSRV